MMRKFSFIALCLGLVMSIGQLSFAQPGKPAIHALDIGDTLPDITLPVANYTAPSIRLQDLRGKLIILDFWNIRCGSCIAAMPKMQALQRQFNSQLQIIMVTTDSISEVQRLAQRVKIVDTLGLPFIMQDSSLFRLFPMKTVPTHVWISPQGVVEYITEGYNTNYETIHAYLQGEKPKLALKQELMDIDFNKPLWLEGNGRHLDKMLFYSYLTSKIQTNNSSVSVLPDTATHQVTRIQAVNVSKLSLFQIALGRSSYNEFNQLNRVVLAVKDPETYLAPKSIQQLDDWKARNLYCYECCVKLSGADHIFDMMHQELESLFQVKASIEKRTRNCWVLISTKIPLHVYGSNKKVRKLNANNELIFRMQQITRKFKKSLPVILDETGFERPSNIQFGDDINDLSSLRKVLNQHGIKISMQKRVINVLVIQELINR